MPKVEATITVTLTVKEVIALMRALSEGPQNLKGATLRSYRRATHKLSQSLK